MQVLFCVGETLEEQPIKEDILECQLQIIKDKNVTIAYEPVWSIGPGKTPPNSDYISNIAKYIKSIVNVPVVYGGGLKSSNAKELASIKEIDGGLVALTRFEGNIGFYPDEFKEIVKLYLE
jgi:triosephosphate isomerase